MESKRAEIVEMAPMLTEQDSLLLQDNQINNKEIKSDNLRGKVEDFWAVLRNRYSNSKTQKLFFYSSGIFFFYLLYGILQEEVTRGDYDGEKFRFSQALVFVQCVINAVFAKTILKFVTKVEGDKTPPSLYGACAFCYMGAMVASNSALMYISYPTQVLGKACKPIPVMILGVIFAHKRYPLAKYFCILLIVAGVAGFLYKDGRDVGGSAFTFGVGETLLIVSLTLDGFTGVTQEKMRTNHSTNHHHMMYNINLWSSFILFAGLILTGQGLEFVNFVLKHPQIIYHLGVFSLTSALGQHFIFLTVVTFGPLTCSVITTTRKFFTILFSVILFQNPMNNRQWVSTALVFTGIALDSIYGKSLKTKDEK